MGYLDRYIPLVEFLGQALGERCEVVLHDLTVPEKSIIAIANGNISGREIGGSVTDFLLKLLQRKKKEHVTYLANYRGKGQNGRVCRSSSYFIQNEAGETIGTLCINVDITAYMQAKDFLEKELSCVDFLQHMMTPVADTTASGKIFENLHSTVDEVIGAMIDDRLAKYPACGSRLSLAERLQLVSDLQSDGLFLLRGGISALAEKIDVSEPTIYRYLSKIKKENDGR